MMNSPILFFLNFMIYHKDKVYNHKEDQICFLELLGQCKSI